MKRLLKALLDFRKSRDSWAWRGNPWVLAMTLLVPVGVVLPLGRLARARINSGRSSNC